MTEPYKESTTQMIEEVQIHKEKEILTTTQIVVVEHKKCK